jgi:hypothetical protein
MRYNFPLILLTFILVPEINAQKPKLMSKDKVVYFAYGQDNPRISSIQNRDTFDVKLFKVADSVYSYQSEGYLSMKLEVNRTNKAAKYEDGNYDENAYDKASLNAIRNSYVVKFVDNRIFEENDIKYFIYAN